MRKTVTITLAAGSLALAAITGLSACGSTHATAAAQAPPASTAPASPAPAASAPSATDRLITWAGGPGYTRMLAVQADLDTVSTDADAQDLAAVTADGTKLAADARNAGATPPPAGTGSYTAAMADFAAAGDQMASGDLAGATASMQLGTPLLEQVTIAVKALNPDA